MSWFSKILPTLIQRVLGSKDFQQGMSDIVTGLGSKLMQSKDDPAAIKEIAQDMMNHPQALIGAAAAGTPVESHVDALAVHAAQQIAANADETRQG